VYFDLMMRIRFSRFLVYTALLAATAPLFAQSPAAPPAPNPEETEVWEPVPAVVTPGATCTAPPSDAIVLFNGKNLDEWVLNRDKSPANWIVADGVMTVNKAGGNIETKRTFKNYQLHIEWRIPENITGSGQARGNSGVFLASTGPGDDGYELQVLDSYQNKTYVNGMGGSIYKQSIPLVNPGRKPGGVAELRRGVDGAGVQRGRLAQIAGLCHSVVQRRAGAESLRVEGPDALPRQAVLQGIRNCSDQAAGARRQK
jgi:hypothetical protein